MINNISEKITRKWVDKEIIKQEDYELYHYGWFIFLSDLWFFLFTFIIGMLFNVLLSSLVFFVTFFVIRRFAGGFHAKTELSCQIFSLSALLLSIVSIKYLFCNMECKYLLVIQFISVIALVIFSPADTPQKPLNNKERKMFKKIIGCMGIAFFAVNCILFYYNIQHMAVSVTCAFVLETILVILGRLLNKNLADN